uniref:Uncharacterized protein n=1 Tax=Coccolithus braarudii TaxID=221442 RepID=A0A7S0Q049_9EUKA|mmetsp:Transcript_22185/g.47936  ORF Transcript_22185/g.47936 Transcript_22185/m.47936 type:complete len:162 (+) Transcript_22185:262-747(+)
MTKMLTGRRCAETLLSEAQVRAVTARFLELHRVGNFNAARDVLDQSVAHERHALLRRVPQALTALQALRFAGITEEWGLSVALFHAKLARGSPTAVAELHNMRPASTLVRTLAAGNSTPMHQYDTQPLEGVLDPADEEVYRVAVERFSRDVAYHLEKRKPS